MRLKTDLIKICDDMPASSAVSEFRQRIECGNFTKEENPESHFCVYFAAYDSTAKKLFLGHHKKSGLWLFNGGHIDRGETIKEALVREIDEEWGLGVDDLDIKEPELLTITPIDNPGKQICRSHYDIWFFIDVLEDQFNPDQSKLLEEFHKAGWKSYDEAKELVKDKNTLIGIDFVVEKYFR